VPRCTDDDDVRSSDSESLTSQHETQQQQQQQQQQQEILQRETQCNTICELPLFLLLSKNTSNNNSK